MNELLKQARDALDKAIDRAAPADAVPMTELVEEIDAALAAAAEPVKVKPLAWNPYRAETPFGYYHIDDQTDRPDVELKERGPFLLTGSRVNMSRHFSLADARAAAQADFESKITLTIDT